MGRVPAACVSPVTAVVLAFLTLALPCGVCAKEKAAAAKAEIAAVQQPEAQPDLTQLCANAGDSPVCALKAWMACVLYDAAPACKAATGGQVAGRKIPRTDDKDVVSKPWSVTFDRLMPEAFGLAVFDGSNVPVERIAVYGQDAHGNSIRLALPPQIPKTGVYEMFIRTVHLDTEEWTFEISILLTRQKNAWRVIGWSSTRPKACAFDPRAAARGGAPGGWAPCRLFIPRLSILDLADNPRLPVWHSPRYPGPIPYPHRGADVQVDTPGDKVGAPMSGTIRRRPRVYLDTNAYDWVVIDGKRGDVPLEMKLAYVSTDGPAVGTHVNPTIVLGRQQPLRIEFPYMNEFVHWEVVLDGRNMDPTPFRAASGN